jgi:hypothetical protein
MRLVLLPKLYLRKKSSLPFLYRMGLTGTHKLELGISPMRQCCREEDLRSEHGFRHSHLFIILLAYNANRGIAFQSWAVFGLLKVF